MPRRGVGLMWWRRWRALRERWHRRCTTVTPRRRTSPFGGGGADEGVPAAQGVVGASASAWRVCAAAVRRSPRRRVGAGRWGGKGGVLGACWCVRGIPPLVTRNGRRSVATSMPFLAWSRPCQCRHRHRSLTSELQMRRGLRHRAPNEESYNSPDQSFCKFKSWSD